MFEIRNLGKNIRRARLEKNLSMDEVAKEVNISRATLSEIEKGNLKCEIGSYLKTMSLLGIEMSIGFSTKSKQRKRATRRILKRDKKINHWVVFTIELYANHINKPTDIVFKKLEEKGLIDLLYSDYEDLHGMSPEYVNDYLDGCFKGENL